MASFSCFIMLFSTSVWTWAPFETIWLDIKLDKHYANYVKGLSTSLYDYLVKGANCFFSTINRLMWNFIWNLFSVFAQLCRVPFWLFMFEFFISLNLLFFKENPTKSTSGASMLVLVLLLVLVLVCSKEWHQWSAFGAKITKQELSMKSYAIVSNSSV